ncbi:MAG: diguanylate cyclase, partial [Sphingomonas sp.]
MTAGRAIRQRLDPPPVTAGARRDVMAGGILVATVVLLLPTVSRAIGFITADDGITSRDNILATALCLNVALLLFGWRRYRDLSREVGVRTAAEERAQTLASRDPLTGFLNRRALIELAGGELAQAEKRGKILALVTIDLDHFKNVNDVHGHLVGDQLLAAVADAITQALPPTAITARLGGDEFACAFAFDPANPHVVDGVAERLVTRLSQPFELDGVRAHVSASIGIARSDDDAAAIDGLMRRTNIAMNAAKKMGRNRFCWFDASMERELQARNTIEAGLRAGIPRDEIVPYYEQQIDLTTGTLHGFEVLARWN